MTHSSGLPPEPTLLHARARSVCADPDFGRMHPKPLDVPADICDFERISTYEDLMALMARQDFPLLGPPGTVLNYSNEGYVLLAAIVERASGQSFAAYLQDQVLDPLGMARTGLYSSATPPLEPEVVPFAVDTRGGKQEVFASPAWWDQGQMVGNGGLKSTTRDLLRYLEVYRTGGLSHGKRIVSAASVEKMAAPHMEIPTGGYYGYGLRTADVPAVGRIVEHSGGNKGVSTHVVVAPEHGLTAVTLTNLANAPAPKLAYGAINAYLGRAADTPWTSHPEHEVDPRQLGRFVGTYRGTPGVTLSISVQDDVLRVATADEPQPARPYADRAFFVPSTEQELRFLENERGQVWAVAVGLRTYPRAE
jgi:CubicO group peptidase (beta-lactamase class C family)